MAFPFVHRNSLARPNTHDAENVCNLALTLWIKQTQGHGDRHIQFFSFFLKKEYEHHYGITKNCHFYGTII